jgi:hypothetical protein
MKVTNTATLGQHSRKGLQLKAKEIGDTVLTTD